MTHFATRAFVAYQVHLKTIEINSHINSVMPLAPLPCLLSASLQRSLPDAVTRDLASASLYAQCWSRSTTLEYRTTGRTGLAYALLFFISLPFVYSVPLVPQFLSSSGAVSSWRNFCLSSQFLFVYLLRMHSLVSMSTNAIQMYM